MVVTATKLLKTLKMICLAFSCETMAQSKKETKVKNPNACVGQAIKALALGPDDLRSLPSGSKESVPAN